jgi:adenylate kinase family enzyme
MRLWIFGAPGSGKTTLARALSRHYGLQHRELDELFWEPGWRIVPQTAFLARVEAVAQGEGWIVDGNYTAAGPVLSRAATGAIWLDLPLRVTYPRVLRRSLSNAWHGRELFSGNTETFGRVLAKDGMPAYAVLNHRRNAKRYQWLSDRFPGPQVRLTAPRTVLDDAVRFCEALR